MAGAISCVDFMFGGRGLRAELSSVLAAGYTGRDQDLVKKHVDELAEMGVAPPPHIPMLYPVMPTLVTTAKEIAVLGTESTPEVEVAILRLDGGDYVTVASDHTDRRIEAMSVPQSKNACPKIVGRELWSVQDVLDRWDKLQLTSRCGGKTLQEGTLGDLLPMAELLDFADRHAGFGPGSLLLSGTVPTLDTPPKGTAVIELSLRDPIANQALGHAYTVKVMEEYFA